MFSFKSIRSNSREEYRNGRTQCSIATITMSLNERRPRLLRWFMCSRLLIILLNNNSLSKNYTKVAYGCSYSLDFIHNHMKNMEASAKNVLLHWFGERLANGWQEVKDVIGKLHVFSPHSTHVHMVFVNCHKMCGTFQITRKMTANQMCRSWTNAITISLD